MTMGAATEASSAVAIIEWAIMESAPENGGVWWNFYPGSQPRSGGSQ
jgi:hypothetical protein